MADLTDAQLERFIEAFVSPEMRSIVDDTDRGFFRDCLGRLRKAGFTIEVEGPDEPRYYAERKSHGSRAQALVRDRRDFRVIANFWRSYAFPDEIKPARELCARLNAGHGDDTDG